ncbi:MAG: glycosyltransferase family 2 protein [Nitrospira sp.]|nr:glycosyltransferase family 2 protein [bacterium]MBL7050280.1 glycosyltransferase family 2 protein [Nitrospira sp.]
MEKILIVVPCYNEEESLPGLLTDLRSIRNELNHLDFLFVNDCSSDNTEKVLAREKLPYVNHPINMGYNAAIQTGVRNGLDAGYENFIILDGDGQHPPIEIKKLIHAYEKGADIVIGSRFKDGFDSTYEISAIRKAGMMFFSFLTSILIGAKIKDTTSGYQIFNDRVARALLLIYEGQFPDAEVIFLLNLLKFRIAEVPVEMKRREMGESMFSSLASLYYPFRVVSGLMIAFGRYFVIKGKLANA